MIAEALAVAAETLGADARSVLARLGGPLGHGARIAAGELAAIEPGSRRQRRAELVAAVRSPVPAGLRLVHPTWIEHGLQGLPTRARAAVAGTATGPVDVWLARWATASIPPIDARETRDPIAWLVGIGADQVAFALGAEAANVPALAAAAARIAKPPRAGRLGPRRAAIERCRGVSLDDPLAFVRVAGRALAPHLAAERLVLLQLSRRLPRAVAIVVEREVAAHAATSFDQCPAWSTLVAE